jgi:hypothetical protein
MSIYYSFELSHSNPFNKYTKEQHKGEETWQYEFLHTIDNVNENEEK